MISFSQMSFVPLPHHNSWDSLKARQLLTLLNMKVYKCFVPRSQWSKRGWGRNSRNVRVVVRIWNHGAVFVFVSVKAIHVQMWQMWQNLCPSLVKFVMFDEDFTWRLCVKPFCKTFDKRLSTFESPAEMWSHHIKSDCHYFILTQSRAKWRTNRKEC